MIERDLAPQLKAAAAAFPAVTLTGPRQSGKSTLAKVLFPEHGYANLEAPDVRAFAQSDPRGFLAQFEDQPGAVLDEIQQVPELASYIQPLIDDNPAKGRWILTGSQNLSLLETVSQSLAGRTAVLHLLPLSYTEITRFSDHPTTLDEVLLTGGYPRIYNEQIPASDWLAAYVATYIERDVRSITQVGDLAAFQRFIKLCAGRTGQLLNYSSLASDCGITQPTAKAWVSILEASFIAFPLQPWSGNINKRLVKMPKLHFYDTGLVCWLLDIRTPEQLATHPSRGAIFETWVVSEIIKHRLNAGDTSGRESFYRDKHGVEADLLVETGDSIKVIEVKAGQTVTNDLLSPARRIADALSNVATTEIAVIYGGDTRQERSDVTVVPWREISTTLPQ